MEALNLLKFLAMFLLLLQHSLLKLEHVVVFEGGGGGLGELLLGGEQGFGS